MPRVLQVALLLYLVPTAAYADSPPLTLGVGVLALPAEHVSMVGPSVTASYSFSSLFALDATASGTAMFTDPVELGLAFGLGPTFRIGSPHSVVLGLRGALIVIESDAWPAGLLVAGYAYRGESIQIEVLSAIGILTSRQVSCISGHDCRSYVSSPGFRYPGLSVTIAWPISSVGSPN